MSRDAERLTIREARWPQDRALVAELLLEYFDSLDEDIGFQNTSEELASLPGGYARPSGVMLIASRDGVVAGLGAYRRSAPQACEMKRLYVRPVARGSGAGMALASALIADARAQGYRVMLLDTLASMQAARALYHALGFRIVAPYYDNPLPDVAYMALDL
jgi:ribosomal protein S18 acetylase RimI-like enzyme